MNREQLLDSIVAAVPRTQHRVRRAVRRAAARALDKVQENAAQQHATVSELVEAYDAARSCSHSPSMACRRCLGREGNR